MHVSGLFSTEKADIRDAKVDIQDQKLGIESVLLENGKVVSAKTMTHIQRLLAEFGYGEIFYWNEVMNLTDLKKSGASQLISKLMQTDMIEPVSGYGKGKYRFKNRETINSVNANESDNTSQWIHEIPGANW